MPLSGFSFRWLTAPAGVILLICLLAFGRVVFHDFVTFDDPHTIFANPHHRPPAWTGLIEIWSSSSAGLYVPLTRTIWLAGAWVGGATAELAPKPWVFHLLSLAAHATAGILVLRLLRRYIDQWAATIGAALFVAHPLQVESVAWASGLKDVMAGMLALGALNRLVRGNAWSGAIWVLLAMLSKPTAIVAIPMAGVLLLVLERRPTREVIRVLLPAAMGVLPLVWIAALAQETAGIPRTTPAERLFVAADALAWQTGKLVWPVGLALDYGRSPPAVIQAGDWGLVMLILTLAAAATWLGARYAGRMVACGALVWVIGLAPTLGLVPFQWQFRSTVADHYAYSAMIGAGMFCAGLLGGVSRFSVLSQRAGIALVGCLAMLSARQTGFWSNSLTLYQRAIWVNPKSPLVHNNLGTALAQAGRVAEAIPHFEQAQELHPSDPMSARNLAMAYWSLGRPAEAARYARLSMELHLRAGESADIEREILRLTTLPATTQTVPASPP
jgi:hypothetical protein